MSFSGKTLLVPEFYKLPDNIAFFKVIQEEENPFPDEMPIKQIYVTRKDHYSPYIATVVKCYVFENVLMFLIHSDDKEEFYGVNTVDHYIMEKDEIDSVLHIEFKNILEKTNDDMENRLIQEMISDPSIFKKIPQELKDKPSFKSKVGMEGTKRKVRVLDTIGDRTGAIHIPGKLPHEISRIINGYLDTEDIDEKQLNEEKERKTRREQTRRNTPPQENAREGYFSRFRRMFGMVGMVGKGTRKRNRTRKNKKKRYGRL
jgi:hypothetical protein